MDGSTLALNAGERRQTTRAPDDETMNTPVHDYWGDVSYPEIEDLAARHGTPLYLYDADAVRSRIASVRSALRNEAALYYAVKANPNLELLRGLRPAVDGLDVSSAGEVDQALLAGYAASDLSYAGPAKTAAELAHAIDRGVGSISAESVAELAQCAAIAAASGKPANVAVRVNPLQANRSFGLKMGGRAVQFGVDEEELDAAAAVLREQRDHLRFRGIHVYAGSQCFDPDGALEGVQNTLRIVEEFEARSGLACATVNLGGGWGVAHGAEHREMDVPALAQRLLPVFAACRARTPVKRRIVFELGRYLVTQAGLYVTRVIRTKSSRGKAFCLVDGGLHHHLSAAGTFGAALRANFPLRNLSRPRAQPAACSVAGSSCNPTDLLAVDALLPRPECGDLLGILGSGSYGMTASPLLFLGRPTPVELVRRDGEIVVGRRRRTMADFN